MEFKPTVRGHEAGIVLWWSQHSYASLGVVASEQDDGKVETRVMYKGAAGNANEFKVSQKPY